MREVIKGQQRILVVDDSSHIHEDFREVLLDVASVVEVDKADGADGQTPIAIDSAYQGEEAVAHVGRAAREGRPYSLAFVDVRMPPGMDGLETTARLWQHDGDLQVVLCTAFADYDWREVSERLDRPENLFVLKKPFDPLEVRQMVSGLLQRRQRRRSSQTRIERLRTQVRNIQDAARHNAQICSDFGRRAQEAIDRKEAENQQQLGDMAATVNHEVNNPLTCIITSLDLVLDDLESPDHQLDDIAEMLKDAQEGASRIVAVAAELRSRYCDKGRGRFVVTESPAEPASGEETTAARVLVIDDDPAIARAMARSLREHEVTVCTNPDEALGMCLHGDYDVILCDYTLGALTGREIYEAVRAANPETSSRMVFLTGGGTSVEANDFLASSEIQVVYKPVQPAAMQKLVAERRRSRQGA